MHKKLYMVQSNNIEYRPSCDCGDGDGGKVYGHILLYINALATSLATYFNKPMGTMHICIGLHLSLSLSFLLSRFDWESFRLIK